MLYIICNSLISFASGDSYHTLQYSTKWVEFLFSQFMSLSLENSLMKQTCYKMRKQGLSLISVVGNTEMGKNFLSTLFVPTMADNNSMHCFFPPVSIFFR